MIQVGLVLAGAPGHFFKTLTGLIVVARGHPQHRRRPAAGALEAARRLPAQQRRGRRGDRCGDAKIGATASIRTARAPTRRATETAMTSDAAAGAARKALPAGSGSRGPSRPRAPIEPIPAGAVPVMEAVSISKGFGATTALVDVSLKAYAGRILALLGDNGAGKSTLIKILSGVFPPDRGELRFSGEPVRLRQPRPRRGRAASPRCSRTSRSASSCR